MKARLLYNTNNVIQLLLCNGKIVNLLNTEAADFILHFDDEKYYQGPGKWDYEDLTMEDYTGETIAVVDDNGVLHVENAEYLRAVLSENAIKYLTAKDYGEKHGKKSAIIRRLCLADRLPGAILKGKVWLIPENCPYPKDERYS